MTTNPSVPQFWHVSYPVTSSIVGGGSATSHYSDDARNEYEARRLAQMYSRDHGNAKVTNRQGLVAAYINGEEVPQRVAAKATWHVTYTSINGTGAKEERTLGAMSEEKARKLAQNYSAAFGNVKISSNGKVIATYANGHESRQREAARGDHQVQIWHVAYTLGDSTDLKDQYTLIARDEQHARHQAISISKAVGQAKIFVQGDLIAIYNNGVQLTFDQLMTKDEKDKATVKKAWDGETIEVEQKWLDRAKELLREHGITATDVISQILEREMDKLPYDYKVSQIIVVAMREMAVEHEKPAKLEPGQLKLGNSMVVVGDDGHLKLESA